VGVLNFEKNLTSCGLRDGIKFFCINSNKRKKNSLPGKIKKKNKTKSKIIFY